MSDEGTFIRNVTSILILGEEVVFPVYEGSSAAAVRQLNERAGIPVAKIVEAVELAQDWETWSKRTPRQARPAVALSPKVGEFRTLDVWPIPFRGQVRTLKFS